MHTKACCGTRPLHVPFGLVAQRRTAPDGARLPAVAGKTQAPNRGEPQIREAASQQSHHHCKSLCRGLDSWNRVVLSLLLIASSMGSCSRGGFLAKIGSPKLSQAGADPVREVGVFFLQVLLLQHQWFELPRSNVHISADKTNPSSCKACLSIHSCLPGCLAV